MGNPLQVRSCHSVTSLLRRTSFRSDPAWAFHFAVNNDRFGFSWKAFVSGKSVWCARRDSNSRPNAPEAFALSS